MKINTQKMLSKLFNKLEGGIKGKRVLEVTIKCRVEGDCNLSNVISDAIIDIGNTPIFVRGVSKNNTIFVFRYKPFLEREEVNVLTRVRWRQWDRRNKK